MGYYISLIDSCFHIKKENFDKALQALKDALAKIDAKGNAGIQESTNFIETMKDEMMWELVLGTDGDVWCLDLWHEKLYDDDKIFAALAPFVEDNSFIEIGGEEHERWRWVFKNGKMSEIYPYVLWKPALVKIEVKGGVATVIHKDAGTEVTVTDLDEWGKSVYEGDVVIEDD